jgi:hypothetical protein
LTSTWHSIDDTNLFDLQKEEPNICPIDDEPDDTTRDQSEAEATTNEGGSLSNIPAAVLVVVWLDSAMVIALRIVKVRRDTQFGRDWQKSIALHKGLGKGEDNSWESFDLLSILSSEGRHTQSR